MAQSPASKLENPVVTKAREKQELIEKLRRDIFKVDRSIGETDKLIAKSRNAPYLPDLEFRLAELYVEKSRYTYYLQAETRPEGQKGALCSRPWAFPRIRMVCGVSPPRGSTSSTMNGSCTRAPTGSSGRTGWVMRSPPGRANIRWARRWCQAVTARRLHQWAGG